jgi:FtsZ-binding cell division protein ZapB
MDNLGDKMNELELTVRNAARHIRRLAAENEKLRQKYNDLITKIEESQPADLFAHARGSGIREDELAALRQENKNLKAKIRQTITKLQRLEMKLGLE